MDSKSIARAGVTAGLAFLATACSDPSGPSLTIVTSELPSGREAMAYSAGVDAEGGTAPYTWSVLEGRLPPGLSFATEDLSPDDDVVITGAPTSTGLFTFTLQARDDRGRTTTRDLSIEIPPPVVAIDNLVLPPALVGWPYDVELRGSGGLEARSFAIRSGSLPAGLTLVDTRIQGTPTETDTVTLEIVVTSGDESDARTFELAVIAERADFQITILPVTPIPTGLVDRVRAAVDLWEAALTSDLEPAPIAFDFFRTAQCGGFGRAVNGTTVEDILIIVNIAEIDGPGQILGQAGPCATRGQQGLPVTGILTLDSEDLGRMGSSAVYTIAHEIGHVLGFGSGLWGRLGLLEGAGTGNPYFTGPAAVSAWNELGGSGNVPVEGTGGQGTADSHWRETTFGNELMTGFLGTGFQPLSRVSIASMQDLGYGVDLNAAQTYSLPAALRAGEPLPAIRGWDLLLDEPIRVIDMGRDPRGSQPKTGRPR